MKIKVKTKVFYGERAFWSMSYKPRYCSERPHCDRYDVVYVRENPDQNHGELFILDVPKGSYAVLSVTETEIEIEPIEPEFPNWVTDPVTDETIEMGEE